MPARLPTFVFLAAALTNLAPAQNNQSKQYDRDLQRIAELHGLAQQEPLRTLLLGELPRDTENVIDSIFRYERQLRPALITLLEDKSAGNSPRRFSLSSLHEMTFAALSHILHPRDQWRR